MVADRFTGAKNCSDTKDRIVNLRNLSQQCFVGHWSGGRGGDIETGQDVLGGCSEILLSVIIPHVWTLL